MMIPMSFKRVSFRYEHRPHELQSMCLAEFAAVAVVASIRMLFKGKLVTSDTCTVFWTAIITPPLLLPVTRSDLAIT